MNLRKNIFTALLLAMGYIMHQVVPGTIGNMKFDFMLSFLFAALLINRGLKDAALAGMLAGGITALTTTFPGGQIPNIIDKLTTALFVYLLLKALELFGHKQITTSIAAFAGTIVSGSVFLYSAKLLVGLPAPFTALSRC